MVVVSVFSSSTVFLSFPPFLKFITVALNFSFVVLEKEVEEEEEVVLMEGKEEVEVVEVVVEGKAVKAVLVGALVTSRSLEVTSYQKAVLRFRVTRSPSRCSLLPSMLLPPPFPFLFLRFIFLLFLRASSSCRCLARCRRGTCSFRSSAMMSVLKMSVLANSLTLLSSSFFLASPLVFLPLPVFPRRLFFLLFLLAPPDASLLSVSLSVKVCVTKAALSLPRKGRMKQSLARNVARVSGTASGDDALPQGLLPRHTCPASPSSWP